MRIGYLLDLHKGGYDQPMPTPQDAHDTMEAMILEGITAERAGFHSIQVPDRHGRTECYFPGPEQILTILARETERVAIGTFTFVATLFHPMKAAEEFAVIDNLSKGRLYTTMSRGYHPGYWQQFGIPQEHLLGRFQEAIQIWRKAFDGERFDFPGKYWQVEQGLLAPQPYQPGGWPIWGGGHASTAAIRRSAEYGECMTVDDFPIDPDMWKERTAAYAEHAAEFGKKPFIVVMRNGWVADTFHISAVVGKSSTVMHSPYSAGALAAVDAWPPPGHRPAGLVGLRERADPARPASTCPGIRTARRRTPPARSGSPPGLCGIPNCCQ